MANPKAQAADFLAAQDLTLLEKPLVFERHPNYTGFLCCTACTACVFSCGLSCLITPLSLFCPEKTSAGARLQINSDSIELSNTVNDCCCHIASVQKSVPLANVQDVALSTNCCLSCFSLENIDVQTAGASGPTGAEISAAFLKDPEEVRNVIRLAAKLKRDGRTSAPSSSAMAMTRTTGLADRLQTLTELYKSGALTESEAKSLKLAILAAEKDEASRLAELKNLLDRGLVTHGEFSELKGKLISQMLSDYKGVSTGIY